MRHPDHLSDVNFAIRGCQPDGPLDIFEFFNFILDFLNLVVIVLLLFIGFFFALNWCAFSVELIFLGREKFQSLVFLPSKLGWLESIFLPVLPMKSLWNDFWLFWLVLHSGLKDPVPLFLLVAADKRSAISKVIKTYFPAIHKLVNIFKTGPAEVLDVAKSISGLLCGSLQAPVIFLPNIFELVVHTVLILVIPRPLRSILLMWVL